MLRAKQKLTGEVIMAYFANKSQAPFSCPECGDPVILKSGKSRVNYFAHEIPLAWNEKHLKDVPIVPIDLRQNDWTIAYNVMRPRTIADPAVVVSNFVQAMAYVWGADGTDKTPLFARLAKEVLWPVYEKKMTLHEVQHLINRTNKRLRTELTTGLTKGSAVQGWDFSNQLSPRDFDAQFSSTVK